MKNIYLVSVCDRVHLEVMQPCMAFDDPAQAASMVITNNDVLTKFKETSGLDSTRYYRADIIILNEKIDQE